MECVCKSSKPEPGPIGWCRYNNVTSRGPQQTATSSPVPFKPLGGKKSQGRRVPNRQQRPSPDPSESIRVSIRVSIQIDPFTGPERIDSGRAVMRIKVTLRRAVAVAVASARAHPGSHPSHFSPLPRTTRKRTDRAGYTRGEVAPLQTPDSRLQTPGEIKRQ